MKKENFSFIQLINLAAIVAVISILISCGDSSENKSQGNPSEKKQESETKKNVLSDNFVIKYNLSGMMEGTMEVLRSGDKLKQIMSSVVMGVQTSTYVYIIDKIVYSIVDISGKSVGMKTDISEYNKTSKTGGEAFTNFNDFEKYLSDKKKTGTEKIIGYDCDIYEIGNGATLSVYDKKYVLKIASSQFTAIATELNTSPKFSDNEFTVPSGIDFRDINTKGTEKIDKKSLDSLMKQFNK